MSEIRAADAARNNADWCDAVCSAHGCLGERTSSWWLTRGAAPPLYPSVVTLEPSVGAALEAVARVEAARGAAPWAVKDSFAALALEPTGFRLLFEAAWIARSALPARSRRQGPWVRIQSESALAAWEAAWGESAVGRRIFLPALLRRSEIAILGRIGAGGAITAGVVAHRSQGVVGVSNFFAREDHGKARAASFDAVADAFPDLPWVGYESGRALAECEALGFRTLGPLRVWIRAS